MHLLSKIAFFLGVVLLFDASARASPIKRDEDIIFFPTAAHWSADLSHWIVPIHVWIFEKEQDSLWRRGALAVMARRLDLDDDDAELQTFKDRARWFLVDNQRRKWLQVTLLDSGESLESSEPLGPTEPNGHLRAELRLQARAATQATTSFWLDYAAVLPPDDDRTFRGESILVAPEGLSVISDIDDTIKITEVTDQEALLANTFLKPFEAVPGMADAYQRLADARAAFHYVSSSPWQLYPLLSDFMQSSAFPRGSFHLRNFRLKDETLLNVFKSSTKQSRPSSRDYCAPIQSASSS